MKLSPGRISLPVGIVIGITAQHASDGLSALQEFEIVVVGTIVSAIVIGFAQLLWRRFHRAGVVVEAGNGCEFDLRLGVTDRILEIARGMDVAQAHAKVLRLRETNGFDADDVVVSITTAAPLATSAQHHLPLALSWLDPSHGKAGRIPARGHAEVVLQALIVTDKGEPMSTPSVFDFDSAGLPAINLATPHSVTFTIEVRVQGRVATQEQFRIDNPWPLPFGIALRKGGLPDPFPYPTVTRP